MKIEDPHNLKENQIKLHINLTRINVNIVVKHHKQVRYQTTIIQNLDWMLTMNPPLGILNCQADFSSKKLFESKTWQHHEKIIISPPGKMELQLALN